MTEPHAIIDATPAHDDGIVSVARAHDFDEPDSAVDRDYRRFIASHGRFVVALQDGHVVGFGGAIDLPGDMTVDMSVGATPARFVTDLFLLPDHQGVGLGGGMLRALVGESPERMTFSSAHQRAVPTYERMGMQPGWRLQYWSGPVPAVTARHQTTEVELDQWQGDRHDLAQLWTARGVRLIHIHDRGRLTGWSMLLPGRQHGSWQIARLSTQMAHDAALGDVLSLVPVGDTVVVCTPEHSSAAMRSRQLGFELTDQDVMCATEGIVVPARLAALHPGLC